MTIVKSKRTYKCGFRFGVSRVPIRPLPLEVTFWQFVNFLENYKFLKSRRKTARIRASGFSKRVLAHYVCKNTLI